MFLKKNKQQKIGNRLIISSTLLLATSLIFVSTLIYYLLSDSLRVSDQNYLIKIASEYSKNIKQNQEYFFKQEHPDDILLLVQDAQKKNLHLSKPKYIDNDFEDEDEIKQLVSDVEKLPLKHGFKTLLLLSGEEDSDFFHKMEYEIFKFVQSMNWQSIMPIIDNDLVEVYTMKSSSNMWIKIARSSEDREEHLASIRQTGIVVIIPFIFLSIIFSFFLSKMILSPLKKLVRTIDLIKSGDPSARANISGSNDEIDLLSIEFNSLVDHNQKLVQGLKSTIDNIAHDLRTPLTRFRMSAESALKNMNDKSLLIEALEDGLENSDKMVQLLNAIMDVSEVQSGTIRLKKVKVDLKNLLESVIDLFSYVSDEKSIHINLKSSSNLYTYADEIRLTQVFANILDNAIKFSDENGRINIELTEQDDQVIVSIKDSGPGIQSEDLPHIWDRLYRADKSRSTQGVGIGLSIVKAVVVAHNGAVEVISGHGRGSTFIVKLQRCNESESLS